MVFLTSTCYNCLGEIMELIKKNYIYFIIAIVFIIIMVFLIPTNKEEYPSSDITIVGDSRMVGLCSYTWYKKEKGACIAKTSMGYSWLINDAISKVRSLDSDKKKNIVVNLGVNDLYNINNYIKKYEELATDDWKGSRIFLLSINPTKYGYDKLNKEIDEFNENLQKAFDNYDNVFYCDTNSYLKKNGFETSDGLHYDNKTSQKIYEQIKKCVYN